ncbi:PD40 domain-containing protein [candidate division KSB1 bacterium]|nr:PD40 domain-containing protein [candidate division KSB1 bacterium]
MRRKTVLIFTMLCTILSSCANRQAPNSFNCPEIDRQPNIYPDYAAITVPPNIAPLNFLIREDGVAHYVEISSQEGNKIKLSSRSAAIKIPLKKWRRLLQSNRGQKLLISIWVKEKDGNWRRYSDIVNKIASDEIESHLAYRLIKPLFVYWDQMGLYQRDLTSFRERPIFLNRATGDNCINCHSFDRHDPDRFLFHVRAGEVGTAMMLAYDGESYKIDTSTPFNSAVAYRAWHPNGRLIAFSANTVRQFFHMVGEIRDVYDKASDLVIYDLHSNTISTSDKIASAERMETYPEWSPDGRYLYYCVTDGLQAYDAYEEHPYAQIKYDLMRIPYDSEKNAWGDVEPMLLAHALNLSVTHPKVSPDGKRILFCMSGYGNFSIYKRDSDLYLMDVTSKEFRALDELNSDKSDSYHCWSQDGRWVVYSSKRLDGMCARPYFSHMDEDGVFSKPFVLPQKDPAFYESFAKTFNIPEFVDGPVTVRPQKLAKTAWDKDGLIKAKLDPSVAARYEEPEEAMWKPVQKK